MAPVPTNEQKIAEAKKVAKSEPSKAEGLYKEVLEKAPGSNEAALRDYENALIGLGELYKDLKRQEDLAELVKASRSAVSSFAKAKTSKLGKYFRVKESINANLTQFDNFLISLPRFQTPSRSKSPPQNHA